MAYNNIMNFIEKTVNNEFSEPSSNITEKVIFEVLFYKDEKLLKMLEHFLQENYEDSPVIQLFGLLIKEKYMKFFYNDIPLLSKI